MYPNVDSRSLVARYTKSLCLILAAAPCVAASANDGVLLTGYNVQFGGVAATISDSALTRESLCGQDGPMAMLNLMNQVGDRVDERMSAGGFAAADRQREAEMVRSELCQRDESFSVDGYAMTYAACRMTMDTASMMTDIKLPPGAEPVVMTMGDYFRAEGSRMTFDRSLQVADGMGATISDINWTGPGDNKNIAGHSSTRWNFEFETGMGASMAGLESLGINATVTTTGYGYYSTDVPGYGIIQGFFDNFASQVQIDQSGASMFAGMLKSMVEMLSKGIPLEMEQTMNSNFRGGAGGGMRTLVKATGIRTVTLADDICSREMVPDYFTVTDMNEQMGDFAGAPGGPGAEGMPGMPELNQSMGDLSKMMEGMTPEQREALSGAGLGSLIPGMGSEPQAAQPQAAPAGTAASTQRSGPSSAELTTDNMVQSVQYHLQVLGIDPGNTNGDLDLNTQIAISEFQASRGMKVTGEVSPQLLGILSAEVDSQ